MWTLSRCALLSALVALVALAHGRGDLGIAIRLVEAAVFAAGILLIFHFWRTMGWIIEKQHREGERPRWTPL